MNDSLKYLLKFRKFTRTPRYLEVTVVKEQSVSDHLSCGFPILQYLLEDIQDPQFKADLYEAWMDHEREELLIPDVDYHCKKMEVDGVALGKYLDDISDRFLPKYLGKTKPQKHRLFPHNYVIKFCDYFEILLKSVEELKLGNKDFIPIRQTCYNLCNWNMEQYRNTPYKDEKQVETQTSIVEKMENLTHEYHSYVENEKI